MTLEQFAKTAGVEIVDCGEGWGGRIGYRAADHPHCTIAGFRTASAAYKSWLAGTFGERTAKAVTKLLKDSEKSRAKRTTQPADQPTDQPAT